MSLLGSANSIGRKLSVLRALRHATVAQVAVQADVGPDVILRLENGQSSFQNLRVHQARKIAAFFEFPIEDLIDLDIAALVARVATNGTGNT